MLEVVQEGGMRVEGAALAWETVRREPPRLALLSGWRQSVRCSSHLSVYPSHHPSCRLTCLLTLPLPASSSTSITLLHYLTHFTTSIKLITSSLCLQRFILSLLSFSSAWLLPFTPLHVLCSLAVAAASFIAVLDGKYFHFWTRTHC